MKSGRVLIVLFPILVGCAGRDHCRTSEKKVVEQCEIPCGAVGSRFLLVGKLGFSLGSIVTAVGLIVEEGDFEAPGPYMTVQSVNGKAIQNRIRLRLRPYFLEKFGDEVAGFSVPKLKTGETWEVKGYETGGYEGLSYEVSEHLNLGLQEDWHHFSTHFVVYEAKKVSQQRADHRGR